MVYDERRFHCCFPGFRPRLPMSLVGSLEDLGLGEILQIISLSSKSGTLRLASRGREGTIIFRLGQVVQATCSTLQENIGEVLIRKGKLDLATLRAALAQQEREGYRERLGAILVRSFGFPAAVIEEVAREQVERIVYTLFAWAEGTFEFVLQDSVATVGTIRMDPLQFMLDQGLNPRILMAELEKDRRKWDSRRQEEPLPKPVPIEMPAVGVTLPSGHINIGEELRLEMGEGLAKPDGEARGSADRMTLLRGMLEELHNPELGCGITLLVLRFAAEFMGRAVIFRVLRDEVVGLGQFGLDEQGGAADERVRSLRIPRGEPSLFTGIMEAKHPAVVRPEPNEWNRYLFGRIGAEMPHEVFLGPIVSGGEVIAVLYGDNQAERRPIAGTEALEIFLSQAGLAMEKALLESKLRSVM